MLHLLCNYNNKCNIKFIDSESNNILNYPTDNIGVRYDPDTD